MIVLYLKRVCSTAVPPTLVAWERLTHQECRMLYRMKDVVSNEVCEQSICPHTLEERLQDAF